MKKEDINLMGADLKQVVLFAGIEAIKDNHPVLYHEHFMLAILTGRNHEVVKWLDKSRINAKILESALREELQLMHSEKGVSREHEGHDIPFSKEMAAIFSSELDGPSGRIVSPLDIMKRMIQQPTGTIERILRLSKEPG